MAKKLKLKYKSNVKGMFREIVEANQQMWIMKLPLQLTYEILTELAVECSEIDNPKLNAFMMRLGLYDVSDVESENFDLKFMNEYIDKNS